MERLEDLRKLALNLTPKRDEAYYHFYKSYKENESLNEFERYGEALCAQFEYLTPSIDEGELIVGKIADNMSDAQRKEWEEILKPYADTLYPNLIVGQADHMAIDYELLLSIGLMGISQKIDGYLETCSEEKKPFYKGAKRSLEAVVKYSENYSEAALKLAENEENEQRKAELLKIAEVCKKVPANGAESFYEAVQSAHFVTYCLSVNSFRRCDQQYQLGHPDRYLYPYYKKDIDAGNITKEEAQLLLDCFGIQINTRVPNGLSSGYMVGGRDENGNIVQNELTEMLMQVVDDIRLVYPAVGLCHTEGMEEKYLKKACEILSHGRSHPAIFNDDVITKGLLYYGVDEKQAHSYIHSTCVEITPVAASNVWVASPYTNMAQILLDVMDREYEKFEDVIEAVLSNLDEKIKRNFEEQNAFKKIREIHSANPLLSCLVNDCLERGVDIEKGGARYNWILPSFVGMANLVDSLYAIKTVVFEEKSQTMASLKAAVSSNFENNEALRLKLLNTIPKYGNDMDEIDGYFGIFTEHIIEECKKYKGIHSNSALIPSVFCWIMHERFGTETGATPDGRTAGFPLGDGSGPCQGREMNGPTASILSSTKWEHYKLIGGVAVNIKFSKSSLGANSIETMLTLIKTYLKRGGFEIQVNVVDKETLEKARITPEEYRDLVVRIGGYSDYFVKLSDEMQREVILRTEHQI